MSKDFFLAISFVLGLSFSLLLLNMVNVSHGLTKNQMVDAMVACGNKDTVVKKVYVNGLVECEKGINIQLNFGDSNEN